MKQIDSDIEDNPTGTVSGFWNSLSELCFTVDDDLRFTDWNEKTADALSIIKSDKNQFIYHHFVADGDTTLSELFKRDLENIEFENKTNVIAVLTGIQYQMHVFKRNMSPCLVICKKLDDARAEPQMSDKQRWLSSKNVTQNEQRFIDVANLHGQFIWETNNCGILTFVSTTVYDLTGLEPRKIIGLTLDKVFKVTPKWVSQIRERLENGAKPWPRKHKFEHRNGEVYWLSTSAKLITDRHGEFKGLRGVTKDVTAEQRALLSLHKTELNYELLFKQIPIGVFQYDTNLIIRDCNDSLSGIVHSTKEILIGTDLKKLADKRVLPIIVGALVGEQSEYRGEYVTNNTGKKLFVEIQCAPFYDEEQNIIGGIGMFSDISKTTRAEKALKYQIELETIALEISTSFISLSSEKTNDNITRGLERIGQFTKADRSYMFLYNQDDQTYSNSHEWCAKDIKSQKENLQAIPKTMFPVIFGRLQDKFPVMIENIQEERFIPDQELSLLTEQDINSILLLPIHTKDELIAVVGLDVCSGYRKWKRSEIIVLQQIGHTFTSAINRMQALRQLRQNELRFRSLVQNAEDFITIFNSDGKITYNSPSFNRVMGYSINERAPASLQELLHPADLRKVLRGFLQSGEKPDKVARIEFRLRRADGTWAYIESLVSNKFDDSSIQGMVVNSRDITDRRKTELELENERVLANALINTLPGIYYLFDEKGNIMRWNNNLEQLSGYSDEEIRKMTPLDFFDNNDKELIRKSIDTAFEKGQVEVEAPLKKKDGTNIPFLLSGIKVVVNGKKCVSGMGMEITERLRAEEQIKASLKEKKILLSEVHHRVKNNLAIITGLLSLQAEAVDVPETRLILRESELRVRSMAMIHEKLYQTEIFSSVEFHSYIEDLCENIKSSYNNFKGIQVNLEMDNLYLSLNKAIPCGLIVNELLTNAFKHAFNEINNPTVSIIMTKKDSDVSLEFSDNGVGLPDGFNIENTTSLGMRLIEGLSGQINGTFSFENLNGTTFKLNFEDSE